MKSDDFARIIGAGEEVRTCEDYRWDNSKRMGNHFVLQRTLKGTGFFEDVHGRKPVPPGYVMLFTVREPTQYGYCAGDNGPYRLRYLSASVAPVVMPLFCRLRADFGSILPMPDDSGAAALFDGIYARHLQQTFRDPFHQSELIYHLLAELYREQVNAVPRDDPIEFCYYYIKNRFCFPFGLKAVADRCGINLAYFIRSFKARYGMPPGTMLRTLRLEHAETMLAATDLGVEQIALSSGFSGANSFARAYRARFGRSPRSHNRNGRPSRLTGFSPGAPEPRTPRPMR